MKWLLQNHKLPLSLDEVIKVLMQNRKVDDSSKFLNPKKISQLQAKDFAIDSKIIQKLVDRLQLAKQQNQKIVVFGDYDADGILGTAILWESLNLFGLDVLPYIPSRTEHGYGLSIKALEQIFAKSKPDLIITVDNGIVAHKAVDYARNQGVDVIITDHHQPESTLPMANQIVHSTEVCGAAVAWLIARSLTPDHALNIVDLVAVATIADMVPLQGTNRTLAKYGLEALAKTTRPGLKALIYHAGLDKRPVDSFLVGFGIAPRINAMGRIASGLDALRLICTKSTTRATELAKLLNDTNSTRQQLTDSLLDEAISQAKQQEQEHLLIVESEKFHDGLVGLIAGRMVEAFYKPAIVISKAGQVARASARSVYGVNIIELIRLVKDDLIDVGGHPMAAGFTVEMAKIEAVKRQLFSHSRITISKQQLQPQLFVDAELPLSLCNIELMERLKELEPYGQANQPPVFAIKNLEIVKAESLGKDKRHLKLIVCQSDSVPLECIFWNQAKLLAVIETGQRVSVAGSPSLNQWNGHKEIQLVLSDLTLE
ncbi:MAG: single-stranded-DNA-specific exonuclease RecJ [Patescibacteria group bacterium]